MSKNDAIKTPMAKTSVIRHAVTAPSSKAQNAAQGLLLESANTRPSKTALAKPLTSTQIKLIIEQVIHNYNKRAVAYNSQIDRLDTERNKVYMGFLREALGYDQEAPGVKKLIDGLLKGAQCNRHIPEAWSIDKIMTPLPDKRGKYDPKNQWSRDPAMDELINNLRLKLAMRDSSEYEKIIEAAGRSMDDLFPPVIPVPKTRNGHK